MSKNTVKLADSDGEDRDHLALEIAAAERDHPPAEGLDGAVGLTMFDQHGSADGTLTVLLPRDELQRVPAQALLRIVSRPDGRRYLGVVTAGPFAEPDSLRADSPVLTAVATHGGGYLPGYHGRVEVSLLGEELADGSLAPPRLRPLPHSPVFRLDDIESAKVLRAEGDLRLGLAVGHEGVKVAVPTDVKAVLPRHTAVLGTTGGGKSTTVAGMAARAAAAGMAVILLDVEGEYAHLHEPTDDARMLAGLKERALPSGGVPAESMTLYHLIGRDCANPGHPQRRPFSLQFARLSPYTVMEMLDLNEAQRDRFFFAYDLAKTLLRVAGIFPQKDKPDAERERQERILLKMDEWERGYPRLSLSLFLDVVGACKAKVNKSTFALFNAALKTPEAEAIFQQHLTKDMPGSASSWGKVYSVLWRMKRLQVFDRHRAGGNYLNYADLLRPGGVSVVDLSDSGMSELTNITLADLLRGVQEAQETAYLAFEKAKATGGPTTPPRALIIIEEAHEFLSEERIDRTPNLFQQVARIAKRGRKRWLGLVFVTQFPQHLPRQVLGLVNGYVLHKITDPAVVATLRKTVSGIDEGLWTRLPGLAPGQAIVSFGHMTRPLLTSIDPTPCKLLLAD